MCMEVITKTKDETREKKNGGNQLSSLASRARRFIGVGMYTHIYVVHNKYREG